MNRQEIKEGAKAKIKGNKWKLIWPVLLISLVFGFIEGLFLPEIKFTDFKSFSEAIKNIKLPTSYYIVSAVTSVLSTILTAGYFKYVINFVRTGKFDTKVILETAKKKWLNILVVTIIEGIIVGLAMMLLIVPGIIMAIAYAFALFLVVDTDKSAIDSLKASREMMKGHKWEYFVFWLTFIGWFILVPLTFGILMIWLFPYMTVANVMIYEKLKAKK